MAAKNKRSTRELKFKNSIRNNKKLKIKKELKTLNLNIDSNLNREKTVIQSHDEIVSELIELIALNSSCWDALQLRIFLF